MAKIHTLPSVQSTNTWAKEHAATLSHGEVVLTHCQTSGRGQRGNSWEAEPGKNLTFSLFLIPAALPPARQFEISEAVALGVAETVERHIGRTVRVKWPNDIYVDDRKIAGILIEHSLSGNRIAHTVAGVGLNVNQTRFLSDAPNPVSMANIAGREFELTPLLNEICGNILHRLEETAPGQRHTMFLEKLWRNDGEQHTFATHDGARFEARIADVGTDGILALVTSAGEKLTFAFKEVAFIL